MLIGSRLSDRLPSVFSEAVYCAPKRLKTLYFETEKIFKIFLKKVLTKANNCVNISSVAATKAVNTRVEKRP